MLNIARLLSTAPRAHLSRQNIVRLALESVESRCSPATIFWDNESGDNTFFTDINWKGDSVPAVGDNLVFQAGFAIGDPPPPPLEVDYTPIPLNNKFEPIAGPYGFGTIEVQGKFTFSTPEDFRLAAIGQSGVSFAGIDVNITPSKQPGVINVATFDTSVFNGLTADTSIRVLSQRSEAVFTENSTINFNSTLSFETVGDITLDGQIRDFVDFRINKDGTITYIQTYSYPVSDKGVPTEQRTGEAFELVKSGTGTLTFSMGAGKFNSYNGATRVEQGTLVLNALEANAAIPGRRNSSLQIGDGIGAPGSAIVQQLRPDQVSTIPVDIRSDGIWDMSGLTVGQNETVRQITSANSGAQVLLGAGNLTLTPFSQATYNGTMTGAGTVTVQGGFPYRLAGPIELTGANPYSLGLENGFVVNSKGFIVARGGQLEVSNAVTGAGGGIETKAGALPNSLFLSVIAQRVKVADNDFFYPATRDEAGELVPAIPTVGDLDLAPNSKMIVPIASVARYGGVSVTGDVTSLGGIRIDTTGGFTPTAGQSFTIIDNLGANAITSRYTDLITGNPLNEGDRFVGTDGSEFQISYVGGDGNDVVITNTDAPTVAVNQADTQSDPTTGTTVAFDAVFSGPVSNFDISKVSLSTTGTLTGGQVSAIQRSPNVYRINVTGLTGTGNVSVALQAGAADSFADEASLASTSVDNSVTVVDTAGGGGGGGGVVGPIGPGNGATNPGSGSVLLVGTGAGDNRINAYRGGATNFTQSRVTGPEFSGGVRVATADFNGDGFEDYVLGSGPGGTSTVRILDGRTGETLFNVNPFESAFTGGVYVAAGDLNGDKTADLVVTADVGGGPRVLVFTGVGFKQVGDFFGIDDPNFRGGARPAIGDVNGDGIGDLIIAAGFGGGPRIAGYVGPSVFGASGTNPPTKAFQDFFAFEQSLTNGVFVTVGDINGDGYGDVIAGGGPGGGPRVSVFSGEQLVAGVRSSIANFFAGDPNNRGGIRLTVDDFQGDGIKDLITGSGDGAGTKVTVYPLNTLGSSATPPVLTAFDAFPDLLNGVFVG